MGVVQNSIDIEKIIAAGGDPELAERVATLEEELILYEGAVTPESPATLHPGNKLYKVGKEVIYQMHFSSVSADTNTTTKIGTLPAGFFPKNDLQAIAYLTGDIFVTRVSIKTDGTINIPYPVHAISSLEVTGVISWITE